jgi:hypothetical protein
VNDLDSGQEPQEETEPKEVGSEMKRLVAYFAIAAVAALLVALCLLVLYAMGVF